MNERYEVRVSPRDENRFIVFDNEAGETPPSRTEASR